MENSTENVSNNTLDAISVYTIIGLSGALVGIILTIVSVITASIALGLCASLVLTTSFITSVISITHKDNNRENRRLASIGIIVPISVLLVMSVYYFIHYGV